MMTTIRHFIIKYVKGHQLCGYSGMNGEAAKELHFKPKMKPNEIWIDKNLTRNERERTIKHEEDEAHLMSNGMHYFTAHKYATKAEHKHKPRWLR
jgi:hypothetical protein